MPLARYARPLLAALLAAACAAQAQQPLKILVGFPPGGSADVTARALADKLKDSLGQAIVVDNRPGAGGRVAADALKNSAADGTTLLLAPIGTTIILPVTSSTLTYDPWKDFAHVSQVATFRFALAVGPGTPAKTLGDFLAWAKANPAKASFGSPGAGTLPHFFGVMIGRASGVELTHVAYKGGAPKVNDMLGGHMPAGVDTPLEYAELHRNGKLTILALSGAGRSAAFPEVPTFKEAGVDVDGTGWFGIHAPAAAPRATIERQSAAIVAAMRAPDMRERLFRLGLEATGTTPEEFVRIMREDKARWEPVIKAIGFKLD
jgi:tripartite-type tricarboxylate transporter receptor subunit TctC